MRPRQITLDGATVTEFRVPRVKTASSATNTTLLLQAGARGASLHGAGEACARDRATTGDTAKGSWRFLRSALDHLHDREIRTRPAQARTDIATLLDELRELARATDTTGQAAMPYRGMLAGLDGALLDLAARAADVPLAQMLGGQRRHLPVAATASASWSDSRLRHELTAAAAAPAIRILGGSDRDVMVRALQLVASETSHCVPVWLACPARTSPSDASEIADAITTKIREGKLPSHVVLELPAGDDPGALAELQERVDADGGTGIVILADVTSDELAHAAADAGVRAINLDPQRLGGMSTAVTLAGQLHDAHPHVRIALSAVPDVSGAGARALLEYACVLPRLDYCAVPARHGSGLVGVTPHLTVDGNHRIAPGSGPGLGGWPDLVPATQHLYRYMKRPDPGAEPPTYEGRPPNTFDMESLEPFTSPRGALQTASPLLERAALAHGLDTTRLSRRFLIADHTDLETPLAFTPYTTSWTGASARSITQDKELCRSILREAGVPVPEGTLIEPGQVDEAVAYASSLGAPVVVKPNNGVHGIGVSTDLRSADDVRSAVQTLASTRFGDQSFVVETYLPGNDYRLLVVGDQVVSVVLKLPAFVVGDGHSTVLDLVLEKNTWRLYNPHTRGCLLEFGQDAQHWLQRQGMTPHSVPGNGEYVRLGSAGNIAAGGESIEVLEETHPSLLDIAVRAVHAFPGLDHAGVDLMGDHRRGAEDHPTAVLEVNAMPATTFNHFPQYGTPRDVSTDIVLRSCSLAGMPVPEFREHLSVRLTVEGRVQGVGYRQWFARKAQQRPVGGTISNVPDGNVEILLTGPTNDVWCLTSSAITGPSRASVTRVSATHVTDVHPTDRFEVST